MSPWLHQTKAEWFMPIMAIMATKRLCVVSLGCTVWSRLTLRLLALMQSSFSDPKTHWCWLTSHYELTNISLWDKLWWVSILFGNQSYIYWLWHDWYGCCYSDIYMARKIMHIFPQCTEIWKHLQNQFIHVSCNQIDEILKLMPTWMS